MPDIKDKQGDAEQTINDPVLYDRLTKQYQNAKSYREKYIERRWMEAVGLVLPVYGEYGGETPWPDVRYDSIGTECVELLGDGMFGNLTPSAQMWFRYLFTDEDTNKSSAGAEFLEELTQYMVQVFNRSTYYDVGPEYLQVGIGVGTASMDIHEEKGEGRIICAVEHPRSVYVINDARGQVGQVFVRRYYTADQAIAEFGEEMLADDIKTADKDNSNEEFPFIETVFSNVNYKPESKFAKDWKYQEYIFREGDAKKRIIRSTGAKTFSKPTWRWKTRGNNPYGWAPVTSAMPDIRTCSQIVRTWLMNLQKSSDPASFDPEEGRSWSRDPGARNYYRDPNRRGYYDQIPPMTPHLEELLTMMQKRVRSALKVDAFLMLMQMEAQMTAREVVERKREGMTITSCTTGKFETETLDNVHQRFLSIEGQAGRLPPVPKELAGKQLKVEYLGPISQMQREIYIEQGIISALETSSAIFQIWPETTSKIKASLLVERIWKANGAPEDALRSDDEYQKLLDAKAKAAQQAQQNALLGEIGKNIDPNVKAEEGSAAEKWQGGTK
jgi:hypothetical protein